MKRRHIITCADCERTMPHYGRGLCCRCHKARQRNDDLANRPLTGRLPDLRLRYNRRLAVEQAIARHGRPSAAARELGLDYLTVARVLESMEGE